MMMETVLSRSDRLNCSGGMAVGPNMSRQFGSPQDAAKNRSQMQRVGIVRSRRYQPASRLAINLSHKQKLEGISTINFMLDSTYNIKRDYQNAGSPEVSNPGVDMGSSPVAQRRPVLTLMYANGRWDASLTHDKKNGYREYTSNDAIGNNYPAVRDVGSYQTFDTEVSSKGVKNLDTVLDVKNLLDRDPSSSRTEAHFQTGSDVRYIKPLGRTFYARAKYKFW